MTEITGRTAFITGGASGIGLGIARELARKGVKLALADLDMPALERATRELSNVTEVEIVQLDVRDRDAFAQAADRIEAALGPVTLLINNAGVAGGGDVSDLTFDLWDWCLGINLGGVINGVQTFLPRMIDANMGGHVVNTGSASGLVGGTASLPYCAAKFGVVGLSESLRAELKPSGIGVSVLCPGPVDTDILSRSAHLLRDEAGSVDSAAARDARMASVLQGGVHPDRAGAMVVAAIRRDQFYIHTDRVILQALQERHEEIVAAMPAEQMNAFTATMSSSLAVRRSA